MRTTPPARWGSIALAAVILYGLTAWLSTPACAAVGGPCSGGGSGTTTSTCSTTSHTTYTVPGGGIFGGDECPFLGNACPVGTSPTVNHTETAITTTVSLGPGTIFIGECQAQTFFVAAGTSNINTNTHTETFVDCVAADPSAIPTLSPGALAVMVALMVAGGLLALRRRRA